MLKTFDLANFIEMLKAMGIIDNGVKREATTEVIEIGSDTEAEGVSQPILSGLALT